MACSLVLAPDKGTGDSDVVEAGVDADEPRFDADPDLVEQPDQDVPDVEHEPDVEHPDSDVDDADSRVCRTIFCDPSADTLAVSVWSYGSADVINTGGGGNGRGLWQFEIPSEEGWERTRARLTLRRASRSHQRHCEPPPCPHAEGSIRLWLLTTTFDEATANWDAPSSSAQPWELDGTTRELELDMQSFDDAATELHFTFDMRDHAALSGWSFVPLMTEAEGAAMFTACSREHGDNCGPTLTVETCAVAGLDAQ